MKGELLMLVCGAMMGVGFTNMIYIEVGCIGLQQTTNEIECKYQDKTYKLVEVVE